MNTDQDPVFIGVHRGSSVANSSFLGVLAVIVFILVAV